MPREDRDFYESLPVLSDFAAAVKAENASPLPDDWVVGFADVVGSTAAVADGRYKAVNMIGAGVIAAVGNAIGRRPFPFVFGGDGASFATSAEYAPAAASALVAMAVFAREEFGFDLRVATVPVREIRAAGRDVRVARYGATPHCIYAMFSGGGLSWFDDQVKRGAYRLPPGRPGALPDLAGLSCRWGVTPAKNGVVLSLIVAPRGDDPRFHSLVAEIIRSAIGAGQSDRPVTLESLKLGDPARAIALETAVSTASGSSRALAPPGLRRSLALIKSVYSYVGTTVFFTLGLRGPRVSASGYKNDLVANADFRKFDDGLRMTLDCTPAFADALEAKLSAAAEFVHWGAFRQEAAQVTCLAPSVTERGHVHFVDGAGGGYTMAARAMKARKVIAA